MRGVMGLKAADHVPQLASLFARHEVARRFQRQELQVPEATLVYGLPRKGRRVEAGLADVNRLPALDLGQQLRIGRNQTHEFIRAAPFPKHARRIFRASRSGPSWYP